MGKHETITAEISDTTASAVREAVEAGDFESTEDVVRHALTQWRIGGRAPKIGSDELLSMLDQGLEGPGRPAEDVFDDLDARLSALIDDKEQTA